MAVHHRVKIAMQFNDTDPKNWAVINPCFRHNGAIVDMDGFCSDLLTAIQGWNSVTLGGVPITVRSYDIQGTKPVYHDGEATANLTGGTPAAIALPPELAVVFSFYSGVNAPRKRGRLFIPAWLAAVGASPGKVISNSARTKVSELAALLSGAGGADVDWIVWSTVDAAAHAVDHWFVSDAWGTVRSRGIKQTARLSGSTSP